MFESTTRSDDGLYYCAAENKGAHVERVGHLTIECEYLCKLFINLKIKKYIWFLLEI